VAIGPVKSPLIGLRDYILSICPPWLNQGTQPGSLNGGMGDGRLMYTFGLLADASLEKLDQAMRSHMPGYGTPTALPLIGDDRVLQQAPGEPNANFILREKSFLRDWSFAGSSWAVLEEVRFYVQPYLPLLRIVKNSGVWDWFEAQAPNWNADGTWIEPDHYQGQIAAPTQAYQTAPNFDWGPEPPLGSLWWRTWMLLYPGLSVVGTTVTGATNASPIAITTSSAHGLATGNQVEIDNVHGNLSANGYWTITVTGADTFTLNGSTGSGAFATPNGIAYLVPASTTLQTASATLPNQVIGPAPFVFGQPGIVIGPNVSAQSPQGVSIGLNVPSSWFVPLRLLCSQWKDAGDWLRWIVFSFDTTLFSPWATSTPNGTWDDPANWPLTIRCADGVI
jgi:hypothetical protein